MTTPEIHCVVLDACTLFVEHELPNIRFWNGEDSSGESFPVRGSVGANQQKVGTAADPLSEPRY